MPLSAKNSLIKARISDVGSLMGHILASAKANVKSSDMADTFYQEKKCDRVQRGERIGMATWRERLREAIARDGRSKRAISLAAGMNEAYIWELLNKDKEPTIGPLQAICDVLKVSVSFILEGIELTPESERLLRAFSSMSLEQRIAFLAYLEAQKPR